MVRFKRVLIQILTIILLICNSGITVHAEDEEYKSFSQLDDRWSSYVYDGGCTIGKVGCAITAITVLMAYANPDLRDVDDWNPKIASQKFKFNGSGAIYWGSTESADKSFTLYSGGKVYEGSALSAEDAKKKVKDCLNKGLYVLICTKGLYSAGTHYSPVVGWNDESDEPLVWDVAGGGHSNWNDWAKQGLTEIIAYQSSLNSSDKMLGKSSSEATSKAPEGEEKENLLAIISENELVGMPDDFSIGAEVMLPDGDSLSEKERISMEDIKRNIEVRDNNLLDYAMIAVTFAGLVLIVYGVLLGVAYLFDKTNNLVEISLLSVLTLGKYVVWDEDYGVSRGYNATDKKMYCGSSEIIKRLIVLEVVGFLLVGGNIFRIISSIFKYIMSFF